MIVLEDMCKQPVIAGRETWPVETRNEEQPSLSVGELEVSKSSEPPSHQDSSCGSREATIRETSPKTRVCMHYSTTYIYVWYIHSTYRYVLRANCRCAGGAAIPIWAVWPGHKPLIPHRHHHHDGRWRTKLPMFIGTMTREATSRALILQLAVHGFGLSTLLPLHQIDTYRPCHDRAARNLPGEKLSGTRR